MGELNALEISNEILMKRSRIPEQDTNRATALGLRISTKA
jgi:hypothetical protein